MTYVANDVNRTPTGPGLRRALTLRDLVVYGVIVVSVTAPMPVYGLLTQRGHGHAALAVTIALFAMLPTAVSYGRMASIYPQAGSAFAYVSYELGPLLGYIAGWGMIMDYLLNPMICFIWASQQAHVFFPAIPSWLWVVIFAVGATAVTAQGIKESARTNMILAGVTSGVVLLFLGAVVHYLVSHPTSDPHLYTRPFFDPSTWNITAIASCTSLAMLTYIGFDGISTLAEESYCPRRDVPRATVLTCVIIGVLSILQVYGAQLVWPSTESFPNVDIAITYAAQRAWEPLFVIVGATMCVALLATAIADQLAVARLLYSMGRCDVLPRGFFGAIDAGSQVPRNNVILVGVVVLGGAILLPWISGNMTGFELGGSLVNFGALTAFMGVNAAAFVRFRLRGAGGRRPSDTLVPVVGFIVCLVLWWNLGFRALVFGVGWMFAGLTYAFWRTRGFREGLGKLDLAAPAAQGVEGM
jgi:putrescine importer